MGIEDIGEALFAPDAPHGTSLALVVLVDGEVIHERYGHQPDTVFGPGRPVTAETPLISWSMAKSLTHALVGLLVADGRLDLDRPAPVAGWAGTLKEQITVLDLLEMRSGLHFVEDYVDPEVSNCLAMLFGHGAADMAAYAAGQPLEHPPGSWWNYSSGSTNIVARICGDLVGGGRPGMETFLAERLFGPVGMTHATAGFDDAGTFVGSSYVHATARDFARFGELYRHDGMIRGTRILPAGWADHARRFVAVDPDNGLHYGRHWWMFPSLPGALAACGYEGQHLLVVPDRQLVVVHLGKTPAERIDLLRAQLLALVEQVRPARPVEPSPAAEAGLRSSE